MASKKNADDLWRQRVYEWENQVERAIPALSRPVTHTADIHDLINQTFAEFEVPVPAVEFTGNKKVSRATRMLGSYSPKIHTITLTYTPSLLVVIHESAHGLVGTPPPNETAHGTLFIETELAAIREGLGDQIWSVAYGLGLAAGLPITNTTGQMHSTIRQLWKGR